MLKSLSGVFKINQINITKKTALFIKVTFLLIAFSYIFYVAVNHKGFNKDFGYSLYKVSQNNIFFLSFIFFLMPINWLAESLKWHILIQPIQSISFFQAVKGVISGISMSFLTVGGVGDFLGRALHINKENRTVIIGITLVSGIYQNLITYSCGGIGLILIISESISSTIEIIAWSGLITIFVIVTILLFNIHLLLPFKKVKKYILPLEHYTTYEKVKISLASLFRYIIILLQYYCILHTLQIEITAKDFFTGISLMLLLKSVIPRFSFLSDLGIREFSALLFFSNLGLNPADIISSTLILWLLNILLPAISGLFVIAKKDLTKKPSSIQ